MQFHQHRGNMFINYSYVQMYKFLNSGSDKGINVIFVIALVSKECLTKKFNEYDG